MRHHGCWRTVAAVLLAATLVACGEGAENGGGSATKSIPLGNLQLSEVQLSTRAPYAGEPVSLSFDFTETAAAPSTTRQIDLYLQSANHKVSTGSLAIDGIGLAAAQPLPIVTQTTQFVRTTTTFETGSGNLRAGVEGLFRINSTVPDGTYDLVASSGGANAVVVQGVHVTKPDKPDLLVAPFSASVADGTLGLPDRPETVASLSMRPPDLYVNFVAANTGAQFAGPVEVALTMEIEGKEHPLKVLQKDSHGLPQLTDTAVIGGFSPSGTKGFIASLYLPPETYEALSAVSNESAITVHVHLDPQNAVPEMYEDNNSAAPRVEYFPPAGHDGAAVPVSAAAAVQSSSTAETAATPTPNPCPGGAVADGNCYMYSGAHAFQPSSNKFVHTFNDVWDWGINPQLVYGVNVALDLGNNGVPSSTYYPLTQTRDGYTIPFGLASQNQALLGIYAYWGGLPEYSLSKAASNVIAEQIFKAQASFVLLSTPNTAALPSGPTPTPAQGSILVNTPTPGGVPSPTPQPLYCDFTDPAATATNRYCFAFQVAGDDIFPPITGPIPGDQITLDVNQALAFIFSFTPVDVAIPDTPIKFKVKIGFDGEFGEQGQVEAAVSSDSFTSTVSNLGPTASLTVTVNVFLSVIGLSVGVEGESTLFGLSTPLSLQIEAYNQAQWATVSAEMPLDLTVLDPSDIILYVGLFGIPVDSFPLVDWDGFSWAFNLFPPFSTFLGSTVNTYDTLRNGSSTFLQLDNVANVYNFNNCTEFHWDSAHNRLCGTGCSGVGGVANQQTCVQFADASDVPQISAGSYFSFNDISGCQGTYWHSCILGMGATCTSGNETINTAYCINGNGSVTNASGNNCHNPQNDIQWEPTDNKNDGAIHCYDGSDPGPDLPTSTNSAGLHYFPPGNWPQNCILDHNTGDPYPTCWGGTGIGDGTGCSNVGIGTLWATCNPNTGDAVYRSSVTCSSTPFVNPAGGNIYQTPSYSFDSSSNSLVCSTAYGIGFCSNYLWPSAGGCSDAPQGNAAQLCSNILLLRDPNASCGSNCRDTVCGECNYNNIASTSCVNFTRGASLGVEPTGGLFSDDPTQKILDPASVPAWYTTVVDYNGAGPSTLPNPAKLNNNNTPTGDSGQLDSFPREIFWMNENDQTPDAYAGVNWGVGAAGWQGSFSLAPGAYDFHLLNAAVTITPLGNASSCSTVAASFGASTVFASPRCQGPNANNPNAPVNETIEQFTVPRPPLGSGQLSVGYCIAVQPLACPSDWGTNYDTRAYWVPSGGWTGLFFPAGSNAKTSCSESATTLAEQVPICARTFAGDDLQAVISDQSIPCRSMEDVDTTAFYGVFTRAFPYTPGVEYMASVSAVEPNGSGEESAGSLCVCNGAGTCNEAKGSAVGRQAVQVPAAPTGSCSSSGGCPVTIEYPYNPIANAVSPPGNYALVEAEIAPSSGFLVDYDVYLDPSSDTVSSFQGLVNTPYLDIWSPVGLAGADASTVEGASAMCIKSARARGFLPIGSNGSAYRNIILGAANMHARATIDGAPAGDVFPLAPTPGEGNPPPDNVYYPGMSASACNGAPTPACTPNPSYPATPTPGPETPTATPPCVPLYTTTPPTPVSFPNIAQMGAYYSREYLVQVPVQAVAVVPSPPDPTPGVANLVKVSWDDWGTCLNANQLPVSARKPMRFRLPEQAVNNLAALYFKSNDDLNQHLGEAFVGCCQNGSSCTSDVPSSDCPVDSGALFVAGGACTTTGECVPTLVTHVPALLYSSLNLNPDGVTDPITTNNIFAPFADYETCNCLRENAAHNDPLQQAWTCEGSFGGPQCSGWQAGSVLDCQAPALVQSDSVTLADADQPLPNLFLFGLSSGPVTAVVDKVVYDYIDPSGTAPFLSSLYTMVSTQVEPTPVVTPFPTVQTTRTPAEAPPTPPVPGLGPNAVGLQVALRRSGSGGETYDGYQVLLSTKQGAENSLIGPTSFAFVPVNSAGQPVGLVEPAAYGDWSGTSGTSKITIALTIDRDVLEAAEPFGPPPCQLYVATMLAVGPSFPGAPVLSSPPPVSQGQTCLNATITMTAAIPPPAPGSIQFEGCVNGSCQTSSAPSNQVVLTGAATYNATNALLVRVFNQPAGSGPPGALSAGCFTTDEQADIVSKDQTLTFTIALTPGDQNLCYPTPAPGVMPTPPPPSCCNCAGTCNFSGVCGSYAPVGCGSCQNFCQAQFGAGCYAVGYHTGENACGSGSCDNGTSTSCDIASSPSAPPAIPVP